MTYVWALALGYSVRRARCRVWGLRGRNLSAGRREAGGRGGEGRRRRLCRRPRRHRRVRGSITVRNQEMEGIDRSRLRGHRDPRPGERLLGLRRDGPLEAAEIDRTAKLAVEIARAASPLPMEPRHARPRSSRSTGTLALPDAGGPVRRPARGEGRPPDGGDPAHAGRRRALDFAEGGIDLFRRRTWLATSEGTAIEQTIVHSGARDRGAPRSARARSNVARSRTPSAATSPAAGWEHIREARPDRGGRADRATEAVELLSAPECPSEVTTLVLDSGQVELQIHESIGHPVELDRVLGMEEAYAGSSFVRPDDRGSLRYASDLVSITADATLAGGLGSFGWDDEGVPGAARRRSSSTASSRTSSPAARRRPSSGIPCSGAMRADGWQNLPLIRMTNISIEPREGTLADIIGDTQGRPVHVDEPVVVDRRQAGELPVRVRDRLADQGRQADRDVPEPQLHRDHDRVLGLVRRRRRAARTGRCGARRTAARASRARSRASATAPPRPVPQRPDRGPRMRSRRGPCRGRVIGPDEIRRVSRGRPGARRARTASRSCSCTSGAASRGSPRARSTRAPGARTPASACASSPRAGSASPPRTTSRPRARSAAAESAREMAGVVAPDPLFPGLAPPSAGAGRLGLRRGDRDHDPERRAEGVAAARRRVRGRVRRRRGVRDDGERGRAREHGGSVLLGADDPGVAHDRGHGRRRRQRLRRDVRRRGRRARSRARSAARRRRRPSRRRRRATSTAGRYEVVLEPAAVSTLVGFLAYIGFGGRHLVEGRSCFSGKRGRTGRRPTPSRSTTTPASRHARAPVRLRGRPAHSASI